MVSPESSIEAILKLVAELTPAERTELVKRLEALGADAEAGKRARVADAIRRVVRDHPTVLAALAK